MIEEYTAQFGILVEPVIEWDKDGQFARSNIIGLEPFLQLVAADKLRQGDYGKDCRIFKFFNELVYDHLSSIPGLDRYNVLVHTACDMKDFAIKNEPYDVTKQYTLEKGEAILKEIREEAHFHDYFQDPAFLERYRTEGTTIKGALKVLEGLLKEGHPVNTIFDTLTSKTYQFKKKRSVIEGLLE